MKVRFVGMIYADTFKSSYTNQIKEGVHAQDTSKKKGLSILFSEKGLEAMLFGNPNMSILKKEEEFIWGKS